MADVTHVGIEEIDLLQSFDRVGLRRAAAALGVSSLGISIEELGPGADEYPEHDHSEDGLGGQMFANRPQQLGQEEIYVALRGSGTIEAYGRVLRDRRHAVALSRVGACSRGDGDALDLRRLREGTPFGFEDVELAVHGTQAT